MKPNYYDLILKSLLIFCNDFITKNNLEDFTTFDFDAHASLEELPNDNLIGIAEFELEERQELYYGSCSLLLSTLQTDYNIQLLRPTLSKLFHDLRTNMRIPIYNDTLTEEIGNIIIMEGTQAMPVSRTKTRPLSGVNINFATAVFQPTE